MEVKRRAVENLPSGPLGSGDFAKAQVCQASRRESFRKTDLMVFVDNLRWFRWPKQDSPSADDKVLPKHHLREEFKSRSIVMGTKSEVVRTLVNTKTNLRDERTFRDVLLSKPIGVQEPVKQSNGNLNSENRGNASKS
ncbi:hypothetical protein V6N12_049149 [Hibiscus sabdariffa]|uniref:Uncharacterized protein n=1 Tax=Hibiscus sabdariffa TaxID=183260 RepID=A0ABR2EKV9_9ROSI